MNFAWHVQIWDKGFQRWGAWASFGPGERERALDTAGKLAQAHPLRSWRVVTASGGTLWNS